MIINTDNADQPGSHWIALFIDSNKHAEYMNSFGANPICCRIKTLLKYNNIYVMSINKFHIQDIFSDNCGKYCILFIKMRWNNMSFDQFLKLFSLNRVYNEILIEKLI